MANKIFSKLTLFFALCTSVFWFGCSKPGDSIVSDGMEALKNGKYENAADYFREALLADTSYSDELLYTFIAAAYTQNDKCDCAMVYYKKALESRKDYTTYLLLASLQERSQRFSEAEETYREAIVFAPKKADAYGSLGALCLRTNRVKDAIVFLEKAVKMNSRTADFHGNLALAYAKNKQKEKALSALAKAEKRGAGADFRERVEIALQNTSVSSAAVVQ